MIILPVIMEVKKSVHALNSKAFHRIIQNIIIYILRRHDLPTIDLPLCCENKDVCGYCEFTERIIQVQE